LSTELTRRRKSERNRPSIRALAALALLAAVVAASGAAARQAESEALKQSAKKIPAFCRGVVVPMITPFEEDGSVDVDALRALTEWLCRKPVSALFTLSGTGEFYTLKHEEKQLVMLTVLKAARGRVAVVPGTLGRTLQETIALSRFAFQHGADAVCVMVPTFTVPGGFYAFYRSLNEALPGPIVVYDPHPGGPFALKDEDIRRIADLKHVVAAKISGSNMARLGRFVKLTRGKMNILVGGELSFFDALERGVVGVVGGGANLYPELLDQIYRAYIAGDKKLARRAQRRVKQLYRLVDNTRLKWPLGGKIALAALGLPVKPVVRNNPVTTVPAELVERIRAAFSAAREKGFLLARPPQT